MNKKTLADSLCWVAYHSILSETDSQFLFRGLVYIFGVSDRVSATEGGNVADDFTHGLHFSLVFKILEIFVVPANKSRWTPHSKQPFHGSLDLINKANKFKSRANVSIFQRLPGYTS